MAEAEPKQSESMEDILQSIKRIIEDDGSTEAKPEAAPAGDVLELTQVVKDDGSIADLPPLPKPAPVAEPAPEPVAEPAPPPAPIAPPPAPPAPKPLTMEEGLVSDQAAQAAAAALKSLENDQKDFSVPYIPSAALRSGNTVEDLILEALKPMLKAWLDEHLPLIVQKIVEKEVRRIVNFNKG